MVSNPTGGFPSGTMLISDAGGGAAWPGAGFNPETQVVFAQAVNDGAFPRSDWCRCRKSLSDLNTIRAPAAKCSRIAGAAGFGDAPDAPKVGAG